MSRAAKVEEFGGKIHLFPWQQPGKDLAVASQGWRVPKIQQKPQQESVVGLVH